MPPPHIGRFYSMQKATSGHMSHKSSSTIPTKNLLFADVVKPHSHLFSKDSKSHQDRTRRHIRGYLATLDSPGFDIYQDLIKLYPKAKVILSVRDSDDVS